MSNIEDVIKHKVLEATKAVEEHLDLELEKLDKLDSNDLMKYREQRFKELKKQQQLKQEWLTKGHGEYTEIDEKEFFETTKKSSNVICHFYKVDTMRCKIVDHHFKILAAKHLEAKFCKLNVERAPFLTDRLKIRVIPAILMVKDSITVDRIVGFTDLGNCDDFSTEVLEWRIARSGIIEYAGDLKTPPEQQKSGNSIRSIFTEKKKTIRSSNLDDSSDDEFLND
ncbi:UNVERIFIED_CONTAM: hypothetical protein PYX00_003661 [Menopon gallinae]|uniref:Phosducin domain-containing protein n=1 Tax=Menopon gallinae TaxID=328185 RepID=A0AAW2I3E7_9NEOP